MTFLFASYVPTLPDFLITSAILYSVTAAGLFMVARNRHSAFRTAVALSVGIFSGFVVGLLLIIWPMRLDGMSLLEIWEELVDRDVFGIRRGWPWLLAAPSIGMFASWLSLEIVGPWVSGTTRR